MIPDELTLVFDGKGMSCTSCVFFVEEKCVRPDEVSSCVVQAYSGGSMSARFGKFVKKEELEVS